MITASQKDVILHTLAPHKPAMVGIFGSFARNENTTDSDLDILVDFKAVVNLLDLIGLEQELSEILGVKVDLITRRSLSSHIEPYVDKDLIRIL
ncbi:hypothetical protein EDD80_1153 [Anseongella ginsenosidimutans]|uniref:Polymerase nucleotidyl transferase domain-containing protein n=1 Tax=Anseongella ginsenosidimutans TaxID=496056 RepID=A0A4R3KMG7_9SPHI|nr:nucleotidyltransferase family protein [Anseongella ginsenosidimutans]QEC51945.1 nucleotidyltransferase family protein [Anseongella ginsenosidimutans]TCS85020.1 hypothetical protein EDD80_1153 [Anseongella ginsenosidimutans]